MTFKDCLHVCAGNKELVKEFDRLTGHNLSMRGSKIEVAIDDATGRLEDGMREFAEFVHEFVWSTLEK